MIAWLTHLQHMRQEYLVCLHLGQKIDDFNRRFFQPQIEGSKTTLELPGIVDQVITMTEITNPEGKSFRAFIQGILNSSRGISSKDNLSAIQNVCRINDLGYLDGSELATRIDIEKDQNGDNKNVIKLAITPDHKEYTSLMRAVSTAALVSQTSGAQSAPASSASNLPSWAQ